MPYVSSGLLLFLNSLWVILTFWLLADGIQAAFVNITIDDHDSRIIYSDDWVQSFGKDYFNETISLSKTKGTNASYTFNGTQIYVFGTKFESEPLSNPMISIYRIDNGSAIQSYVNVGSNNSVLHQQLLFSSESLSPAEHVLEITNVNNTSGFWLDFLVVTTISSNESSTTTTTTTMPDQNSETLITFAVVDSPKFITLSSIIGLSFGGLAFAMIAVFGVLYYKSCRPSPRRNNPQSQSFRLYSINNTGTTNTLEAMVMGLPKLPSGRTTRQKKNSGEDRSVLYICFILKSSAACGTLKRPIQTQRRSALSVTGSATGNSDDRFDGKL
ncbi:hypothetical protein Clacol_009360 [Clathrus columnatus]|uniref:Uncharacterized protein n=1 Tax=Clathrus columnatus TaxID=1419009 RepID=A0AAV5AT50_9AGAM|nr:hypothetical protein Clacol_009360 [Clathrus columnatus]